MWRRLKQLIRRGLTGRTLTETVGQARRVRLEEVGPTDRFVLIIALMVLFFLGLVSLEVAHMLWIGTWNDIVFNGIMLVVGTIVGAVWGNSSQ